MHPSISVNSPVALTAGRPSGCNGLIFAVPAAPQPVASASPTSIGQITFQTLIGPSGGDYATAARRTLAIGRAAGSDICLLNDAVSRRHAAAARHGDDWFLTDLGSKSGTYLNGVRLAPHSPALIKPGDLVKIGPWTFRILGPDGAGGSPGYLATLARTIDESTTAERIDRPYVDEAVLQSDRRLQLLVDFLQRLGAAQGDRPAPSGPQAEATLARAALESILQGSGYARGAILRRLAGPMNSVESVEIVATVRQAPGDTGEFHFSRSLVSRAAQGEVAILSRDSTGQSPGMHSIADLRIHSALCAPIHVGESIEGFLYLDARGSEKSVRTDAAGFCQAAARAYGLALANMRRIDLKARQETIDLKLLEAHQVQEMMLPAPSGTAGGIRYAVKMRPGMLVAGDLFDVVELDGGRIMVSIGDVTGHGIAPAMLMAMVQSQLHAQILRWGDPARALAEVNRYACPRLVGGRNASLWCGVIDPSGELTYVDAGHGHWLIRTAAGEPWSNPGSDAAGLLVGLVPDYPYEAQRIRLQPGWQLALYSDGIIEQRSDSDAMFGKDRLLGVLAAAAAAAPDEIVAAAFNAVTGFAGLPVDAPMADDATVAVVQGA